MSEGDQGTRRYKWFHPRQAARAGSPSVAGVSSKFVTIALYNSSTGPTVLVVRRVLFTANQLYGMFYVQGRLTGTNYPAARLWPGEPAAAGLVDSSQAGAAGAYDSYLTPGDVGLGAGGDTIPIAIVPPGWSFVLQNSAADTAAGVSFVWEELSIDELEYFW